MTQSDTAIVVAGGAPVDPRIAPLLPQASAIIAADSGLDHALALGFTPTMLVGDLDSVSASGLHWAQEHDIAIHRHPEDKDHTDLELALAIACEAHDQVLVVDAGFGRFDHALGNVLLLGSHRWAKTALSAVVGNSWLTVVRDRTREVANNVGDIVSIFPVGGEAGGVITTGLRWPLDNATLEPGSSWGTSNEVVAPPATVTVRTGVAFAVRPLEFQDR